jgi:hypothetical protein
LWTAGIWRRKLPLWMDLGIKCRYLPMIFTVCDKSLTKQQDI